MVFSTYNGKIKSKTGSVSFQAVSKWENGTNYPETEMLPMIASVLNTSIDSLLGYKSFVVSDDDKRYETAGYYWGITPNTLCYEIVKYPAAS